MAPIHRLPVSGFHGECRVTSHFYSKAPWRLQGARRSKATVAIASLRIAAAETFRPPHVSFLAAQSLTFRLLLSRAHLAIEPELIVHAEHAERRACHGFSLPALNF